MKHTTRITVEQDTVTAITCDACEQRYDDVLEMQAFVHIVKTGGYGSIFGDGTAMECDLCQHCLQARLRDALRLEAQPGRL
ncbi:hypothetical protein I6N98_13115 [Spongiibacter nanhainus]|uniref:Uncharacterized protein n=1 Tax=Spongiibacter nanhainus TaxID=2794344 RepID=A0A7T4UQG6_9GAMM|nr:hypothetical protein [Spongiibacter nanhainus]QQD17300.1 hypothetical protein I6N98_13115 [Spongiibacter nanhainus]